MAKSSRVANLQTDFRWDRKMVLALIDCVEEFFEDFYDKSMKKKSIWIKVADRMQEKGHNCSGLACDKKWRNLKSTYIRVLQKQVHGDRNSRFEYFNALHPILGQEIDPDDSSELMNQEESSEPIEPVEFEDLTNDDGFLWGSEEVHTLLDYITECQEAFTSPDTDIDTVWEDIARQMSCDGSEVSSEQCQRKWHNLKEGLKVNQAKAEATGTVPLWPYYTRTREVANAVSAPSTSKGEKKTRVKSQKEFNCSKNQREDSPSKVSQDEAGEVRTVLARVKRIESAFSVKNRLEKLEARVESSRQQQETTRNTNTMLVQALAELRRINASLKQDSSTPGMQGVQEQPPNPGSCSPTSQEFIIVEAFSGKL